MFSLHRYQDHCFTDFRFPPMFPWTGAAFLLWSFHWLNDPRTEETQASPEWDTNFLQTYGEVQPQAQTLFFSLTNPWTTSKQWTNCRSWQESFWATKPVTCPTALKGCTGSRQSLSDCCYKRDWRREHLISPSPTAASGKMISVFTKRHLSTVQTVTMASKLFTMAILCFSFIYWVHNLSARRPPEHLSCLRGVHFEESSQSSEANL